MKDAHAVRPVRKGGPPALEALEPTRLVLLAPSAGFIRGLTFVPATEEASRPELERGHQAPTPFGHGLRLSPGMEPPHLLRAHRCTSAPVTQRAIPSSLRRRM